jgi:hypothetical protein
VTLEEERRLELDRRLEEDDRLGEEADRPEEDDPAEEEEPRAARVRRIVREFGPDVRRRRGKLAGGVAFSFLYAFTRVVEPWPLKVVFDQVLFHKSKNGILTQPFLVFGSSSTDILLAAPTTTRTTCCRAPPSRSCMGSVHVSTGTCTFFR